MPLYLVKKRPLIVSRNLGVVELLLQDCSLKEERGQNVDFWLKMYLVL